MSVISVISSSDIIKTIFVMDIPSILNIIYIKPIYRRTLNLYIVWASSCSLYFHCFQILGISKGINYWLCFPVFISYLLYEKNVLDIDEVHLFYQ